MSLSSRNTVNALGTTGMSTAANDGGENALWQVQTEQRGTSTTSTPRSSTIERRAREMEAKILDRVSRMTISTPLPPQQQEDAAEVSFTVDDLPSGAQDDDDNSTAAPTATPITQIQLPSWTSPLRKRKILRPSSSAGCFTTPHRHTPDDSAVNLNGATPQISNTTGSISHHQPLRKKQRKSTTLLATAPRFPIQEEDFTVETRLTTTSSSSLLSPFVTYEQRLKSLARRPMEESDVEVPSLTTSLASSPRSSNASPTEEVVISTSLATTPSVSLWLETPPPQRRRRRPRHSAPLKATIPLVPSLTSPTTSDEEETPLQLLARSMEEGNSYYSPILPRSH